LPGTLTQRHGILVDSYQFRFVDDTETTSGSVSAADAAHAATLVLQEPAEAPRWKRHGIRERDIDAAPRQAEFVEFARQSVYSLDIRKQGSRKRKPVRVCA
jgi:hypothetical protein